MWDSRLGAETMKPSLLACTRGRGAKTAPRQAPRRTTIRCGEEQILHLQKVLFGVRMSLSLPPPHLIVVLRGAWRGAVFAPRPRVQASKEGFIVSAPSLESHIG
nr:hypothetical protein CFP56_57363 [Quercus suber]